MDGKKVTIVGIVAILIGLLVGYLMWGAHMKTLKGELDQMQARARRGPEGRDARERAVRQARADGSPAQADERRPGRGEGEARADAGADIQGQEVIRNRADHEREAPCKPS